MTASLTLRDGGPADLQWLLSLFDEAVAWMVARGQPGQWGTEPWSTDPRRRDRVRGLIDTGGLRVAVRDGDDVGAVVVGDHPAYVGPIDRPELYILGLIVSRRHAHERIGEWLVQRALAEARAGGAEVVRVDCWAGAPSLVAWYEARGFRPTETFTVGDWTGQVFELSLA